MFCSFRSDSSEPDRKSQKISPESLKSPATPSTSEKPSKDSKKSKTPKIKTPKADLFSKVVTKTKVEIESPENKPLNGQFNGEAEETKEEEKTLKVQSAGAGQAGSDYNPSKRRYHPINDAFWKRGDK